MNVNAAISACERSGHWSQARVSDGICKQAEAWRLFRSSASSAAGVTMQLQASRDGLEAVLAVPLVPFI